jgi:hypothetical protein
MRHLAQAISIAVRRRHSPTKPYGGAIYWRPRIILSVLSIIFLKLLDLPVSFGLIIANALIDHRTVGGLPLLVPRHPTIGKFRRSRLEPVICAHIGIGRAFLRGRHIAAAEQQSQ